MDKEEVETINSLRRMYLENLLMRRLGILFLILSACLLCCLPLWAEPIIENVKGLFLNNNWVRINGNSFGLKDPAICICFDQFEDNAVNGQRLSTGGFWELEEHTDAVYNMSNQRIVYSKYNVRDKLVYGGDNGPFGKDVFNSQIGKKFVSFWCYIGDINMHPTDHWQLKLWRVLSGPDHGSYPTIAFQAWFNPDMTVYSHYYQTTGTDCGSIWGFTLPINRWFYMQLEIQDSSAVDVPDGSIIATVFYGDDKRYKIEKTEVRTRTSNYPDVFTWVKFGYFLTTNVTQGDTVTTYWDDIYIDNSWARIEIGNNRFYDSCTHREMQRILSWDDDVISVNFNQGSFQEGDQVYLFVVDADGNVSEGYPITIGQSYGLSEDVNQDGQVNISDVQLVVNVILGNTTNSRADVNGDGQTNIQDVQEVVNEIIN